MEEAWEKALLELKRELPEQFFEPFIQELSPVRTREDSQIVFGVKDRSLVSHIKDRYGLTIQTKLRSLMGSDITVDFKHISETEPLSKSKDSEKKKHPGHSFDSFLSGLSNEIAVDALKTAAQFPGKNSPLYIYGESGLGKTHLVHACADLMNEFHPEVKILYITMDEFKEFFLSHSSKNRLPEMKKYLRSFQALILEDLQNLSKASESTQEELQYVFDHFHKNGGQIILSADRFVTDLSVNQRLKSRFLSGLPVQIESPDSKMRIDYLTQKNRETDLQLTDSVIQLLGTHITQNLRLLDSALNLISFLKARNQNINDPALIKKHLSGMFQQKFSISPDQIVDYISERFQIPKEEILGKSRRAEITLPRHLSMYLALKLTNLNKSALARYFRKSDHTIIINAEKKISQLIKRDIDFSILLDECMDYLRKNCG